MWIFLLLATGEAQVVSLVLLNIHHILWKKAEGSLFILNDTSCMVCCT